MGRLAQHIATPRAAATLTPWYGRNYIGYFEEMYRLTEEMGSVLHDILVTPDADLSVNLRADGSMRWMISTPIFCAS